MSGAPLAGVRVLDLTSVVVGPACTVRLAGYGADVIKVETFDGDQMRTLGGPSPGGHHSGSYLHLNRGKRAISLNLKRPETQPIIARLLGWCDVFISNMRPEALARLHLDADSVRSSRPEIIHCIITGFGPGGPYRGRAAYDSALQGATGIGGLFARRDGTPKYVPLLVCDHITGEIAAGAITAALFERERKGTGTTLEVPMYETMAALVLQEHLGPASFDPAMGRVGDTRVLNAENKPLQTADGWISLTANTDAQARSFLRAIGRDDALDDPRFQTITSRYRHAGDWFALRNDALRRKTTAAWLEIFTRYDVPAMPCHSLDSLVEDEHLKAVGLIENLEHPTDGTVRGLRPTILSDGTPGDAGVSARPIGWDTHSILIDIGFSNTEIEEFVASGAAKIHARR